MSQKYKRLLYDDRNIREKGNLFAVASHLFQPYEFVRLIKQYHFLNFGLILYIIVNWKEHFGLDQLTATALFFFCPPEIFEVSSIS